MADKSEKKKELWKWLVGAILSLAAIIIGVVEFNSKSEFHITVQKNILTIDKGTAIKVPIEVNGKNYPYQIFLTSRLPPNVTASFSPPFGIADPQFNLQGSISVGTHADTGSFSIDIIGTGAKDSKTDSAKLFFKITTPPFNPYPVRDRFFPRYMGDIHTISMSDRSSPGVPSTYTEITYKPHRDDSNHWAGIYWLYPDKNWGNVPQGRNLTGATRLVFKAKGRMGGEIAEFKIGGVSGKYTETLPTIAKVVTLSTNWQEYSIDLRGTDLSNLFSGFCWTTNTDENPNGCTIYVGDIRFE
ncbi:MAG TPA: hypothetical protein VFE53_08270 [Mucilaginibacter sp.]|nr:hypothetical protein [Mucilaginibacter sp.]